MIILYLLQNLKGSKVKVKVEKRSKLHTVVKSPPSTSIGFCLSTKYKIQNKLKRSKLHRVVKSPQHLHWILSGAQLSLSVNYHIRGKHLPTVLVFVICISKVMLFNQLSFEPSLWLTFQWNSFSNCFASSADIALLDAQNNSKFEFWQKLI